jgi:hypothetical protein
VSGEPGELPLVLRSRAKRGVSKDAHLRVNARAGWIVLRDAMLRIAPQDEAVWTAPDEKGEAVAGFFSRRPRS